MHVIKLILYPKPSPLKLSLYLHMVQAHTHTHTHTLTHTPRHTRHINAGRCGLNGLE